MNVRLLISQTTLLVIALFAATPCSAVVFDLPVNNPSPDGWVDTGLSFAAGTTLCLVGGGSWDIIAGHRDCEPFGPGGLCACDTPEIPCDGQGQGGGFPANNLSAYGLVARVGLCPPFLLDGPVQYSVVCDGNLWVAINDNWMPDNTGTCQVSVETCSTSNEEASWGSVKSLFR